MLEIRVHPHNNEIVYRSPLFADAWFSPITDKWYSQLECEDWTEYVPKGDDDV